MSDRCTAVDATSGVDVNRKQCWGCECEDDTTAEDNDMTETLGQKQRRFTRMIGQLIEYAYEQGRET